MAAQEGRILMSARNASDAVNKMIAVVASGEDLTISEEAKRFFSHGESADKSEDEKSPAEVVPPVIEQEESKDLEGGYVPAEPDDANSEPDEFDDVDSEPDDFDEADREFDKSDDADSEPDDSDDADREPDDSDDAGKKGIKPPNIHIPRPSSRPESLKGFVDAQGNKYEFAKSSERPESSKGFVESANEGEFVNESADNDTEETYQRKGKPNNKDNGTIQVHPNAGAEESKETNGIFTVRTYEAPDSSVDFMYKDGKTPAELEKVKRLSVLPWQNYDRVVRRRKYRNFQELMFAEFKGDNKALTNKQIMNNITRVIFKDTEVSMISDTFKKSVSLPITAMMDFYGFFDFKTFLTKTYTNLMYIELATEDIANRCFRSLGSLDSIWKYQPRLQILVVVGKKVTRDDDSRQSLLLDDLTRYNKLQQAREEFNSRLLKQKGIKNTVRNRATLARYRQDAGASGYRSSNKALNTVGRRGFIGGVLNIGFGVVGFVGGLIGRITGNYY